MGGVSNAYNITPQNSIQNRSGDQAYMEKNIREALLNGGTCTEFIAVISYPDTKTQTPSHYAYSYKLNGQWVVDSFDNADPEIKTSSSGQISVTNSEGASQSLEATELKIISLSLLDEEVTLKNNGTSPLNLKGYAIHSVTGDQMYYFPDYPLGPGLTVTVYSKGGTGDLQWADRYIWNNDGDPAELINPSGQVIDRFE